MTKSEAHMTMQRLLLGSARYLNCDYSRNYQNETMQKEFNGSIEVSLITDSSD